MAPCEVVVSQGNYATLKEATYLPHSADKPTLTPPNELKETGDDTPLLLNREGRTADSSASSTPDLDDASEKEKRLAQREAAQTQGRSEPFILKRHNFSILCS